MIPSREIEANRQAGELFRLVGDYRCPYFAQKFLDADDPVKVGQVMQDAYDALHIDHALRYGESLKVEYCIGWEDNRLEVRFQLYPQSHLSSLRPYGLRFDRETLSAELLRLEREGIDAPAEYRKALRELTQHLDRQGD